MKVLFTTLLTLVSTNIMAIDYSIREMQKPPKSKNGTHLVYGAISSQKYSIGKIPGIYGMVESKTTNHMPAFTLKYDYEHKVLNNFGFQTGISATTAQFRIYNTNFISPNILAGYIDRKVRHNYISIPINLYWKVPISEKSSILLYGGIESFKTINFNQIGKDFGSFYKNDGSSINQYSIESNFKKEKYSLFRVFNFGFKLRFNENSLNRVALGFNYNLMSSYWPLEVRTNFNVANTNYYTENHVYFSGMQLSIGYFL